ncbi:hypothetical protein ElyMa_000715800 [Elysia marginata]|uniref:Uncharacterized protein n=1 Tax=Elysia marginata TaxID=1093978 RepID=A0AAV4GLQ4_9GAST|nr:hypothetical protein ElyMa_000715800 [Elysia marginata]
MERKSIVSGKVRNRKKDREKETGEETIMLSRNEIERKRRRKKLSCPVEIPIRLFTHTQQGQTVRVHTRHARSLDLKLAWGLRNYSDDSIQHQDTEDRLDCAASCW